jgi:5-methylcytosine-specific restriction endonuclease McrA
MKGPHSAETRAKMSKSHTGLKATPAQIKSLKGNKRRLGIKHTPDTLALFKKQRAGSNNSNWRGGVTPINRSIRTSAEYKLWRKVVFERDNYTCIWCGAKSGVGKKVILHADHIKAFSLFPELRFAIDNGRTLCEPCHKTTDTYAGKMRKFL